MGFVYEFGAGPEVLRQSKIADVVHLLQQMRQQQVGMDE